MLTTRTVTTLSTIEMDTLSKMGLSSTKISNPTRWRGLQKCKFEATALSLRRLCPGTNTINFRQNSVKFCNPQISWVTPENRVPLKKLAVAQLVKIFTVLYFYPLIKWVLRTGFTTDISSFSCSYQGLGTLVDHFRSHTTRRLFIGLPWFILSFGVQFLSIWIIFYVAFDLHVVSIFSCNPVFCIKLGLYFIPLQHPCLFYDLPKCILMFLSYIYLFCCHPYCICCLMVRFSLPHNKVGRASVLYNFILVYFRGFFGQNSLFIMHVIFR
jgi:hypothetical protein